MTALDALRDALAEVEADIAITSQALADMQTRRRALLGRIAVIAAGQSPLPWEAAPESAGDYAARRLAALEDGQ